MTFTNLDKLSADDLDALEAAIDARVEDWLCEHREKTIADYICKNCPAQIVRLKGCSVCMHLVPRNDYDRRALLSALSDAIKTERERRRDES